jgi:hypothetical protein
VLRAVLRALDCTPVRLELLPPLVLLPGSVM